MRALLFRRLLGLWLVGVVLCAAASAQAAVPGINPEAEYNVTYQLAMNEVKTASSVKIVDTAELGGRLFLVVLLPGFRTKAYLDLTSIRTIIPVASGLSQDLPSTP